MSARFPARSALARFACATLTAGLLSACATQPKVSSQVESSQYRSRAARNYTAPGPASDPWGPYIKEAAAKHDVPEKWIREVMRQESGGRMYGRNGDLVTSGAGAMGLMQVMPGTYDEIRGRYPDLGDDPYDPHNNILAGTAYIREMYDIYGAPGFLAAYNAGPGRLDDYLTRNRTLPEETRRYVASIGPRISGFEPRRGSPGAQYAMNNMPGTSVGGDARYPASSRYVAPTAPLSIAPEASPVLVARAAAPVVQVAALQPRSGNFIRLGPVQPEPAPEPAAQPIRLAEVAQVPEPPAGNFIRLGAVQPEPAPVFAPAFAPVLAQAAIPEPAREPVREAARLPEPRYAEPRQAEPRYAEARPAARPLQAAPQFAQLAPMPLPPVPVPAPYAAPRSQQQLAAAALVPAQPRGGIPFGLVSPANAEPIGMRRPSGSLAGAWAIQVGAMANEGLAASAISAARDHARAELAAARPSVTPVRQPGGTLYRARLGGLSRDAAAAACERLSRARSSCMMVSPDAQS